MRPLRLDLAGFAVFREPTTVDFTDADFFALVGPTGSGKSTVLDAICFALYGTVPRWGDRRAIANALAPSVTEARVRLVFESAGVRYVLTRVVRRDGKGSVSTRHAGLEALPSGFDLSWFNTRDTCGSTDPGTAEVEQGEVLAGTPAEVDRAVAEVVGLPYEQFTKCVVLPQGEFAAFLHAKPSERQRILVNLLGLDVYGRIRERANGVAAEAEATITMANSLLEALKDADDDAVARATARVETVAGLVTEVDQLLPALGRAEAARVQAAADLSALDSELSRLTGVRPPDDADSIAEAALRARAAVAEAADAITSAEEREEKLRAELAAAGNETPLRQRLEGHATVARLTARAADLSVAVDTAQSRAQRAAAAVGSARTRAAAAHIELEAAREAYQAAVAADRAAALRPHLRVGAPCPVCEHPVAALPTRPHRPAVAAAETAGTAARKAADAADAAVAECDREARACDLALERARTQAEQLAEQRTALERQLVDSPGPAVLEQRLAAIATLRREADLASETVRSSRTAHRTAAGRADLAEERLRSAWRRFDTTRDGLVPLGPPATDREDLAGAWATLIAWVTAETEGRGERRRTAVAAVQGAQRAVTEVSDQIRALFAAAEVPLSAGGPDPARVAAVAFERAESAHRHALQRRGDAQRLRDQRSECERRSRVAKTLATHLRADRFERWLLAEALDSLVDGASRILRELSADQYDLGHDKGEFYVVDHHDAGLRRAVRTLSGGETFQASLALALALSEQLAGLSTAAASLESIMLDEGFGTLDASTMETVAATLENLAARGDRMVGVVTHVGALAERVPVRFEVHRDARTARVERTGL